MQYSFLVFLITESLTLRHFREYKCILCVETTVCIEHMLLHLLVLNNTYIFVYFFNRKRFGRKLKVHILGKME